MTPLKENDLDLVTGGNRLSGEALRSCAGCGVMTPVSQLIDGKCKECSTMPAVQVGKPKDGTISAVQKGKASGGIMMC